MLSRVFKYRSKVIEDNLKRSFPEKTPQELASIKHAFYKNLSDIILETVKSTTISKKQVMKRNKVINHELLDYWHDQNQPIIVVMGHQCNWEWALLRSCLSLKQKVMVVYKPLKNVYFDRFFRKNRSRFGVTMISMREASQYFKENSQEAFVSCLVSDQSPSNPDRAYWLSFLNQDTAVLPGTGLLAKKYKIPVLFGTAVREKRGYYRYHMEPLTVDSPELTAEEITAAHTKRLEQMVNDAPSDWLWSHKRWKHRREREY